MFLNTPEIEKSPSRSFEPLPKGEYRALITKSERKKTRDGAGSYLSVTFDVIEGEFKGRKLWHNFNDDNKSAQAVAIAKSELKALVEAVGHMQPIQYENEFHKIIADRVVWLDVAVREDKQSGKPRNQINSFFEDRPRVEPVFESDVPSIDQIPF